MLELGTHGPDAHREVGALAKQLGLAVIALGELSREVTGAEHVDTPHAAAARAFERTQPGDWILLKASRGMQLERVIDALEKS